MVNWKFWKSKTGHHRSEARAAYNEKNFAKAELHLLHLLEHSPGNIWALDVLGRLLMNTNRHKDAIGIWDDYILGGGQRSKGLAHLCKCHRVNCDFDLSLETLKQMLLEPHKEDLWEEIHSTLDLVDAAMVASFHDSLKEKGISQIALDSVQLRLDILDNNPVAMNKTLAKIFSDVENNSLDNIYISPNWRVQVAEILLNAGFYSEAINIVSYLEIDDPRRIRLEITALRHLGAHEDAREIFVKAAQENNQDHGVLLALIRLAWDVGEMNQVIGLSNTLLVQTPHHPIATRFKLQALVKIGEIQELRTVVSEIINQDASNVQALRVAIDIAFSEDCDWQRTIELSDTVLATQPSDRRALCHKALALARQGSFDKSTVVLDDAKRKYPDNNEVDLVFAEVARQKGDGLNQLNSVNRIFERNGYSLLDSSEENHRLNIQYLSSQPPNSVVGGQLVSVIMTAYQRDDLLDIAIDSILDQTHSNLELIVVDDFSPDDTFEYLQSRAEKEPRLRVFQTIVNGGTYLAKNLGLNHSKGDFIAFMDSDDWTHPQRIERQLARFDNEDLMGTCDAYFRIDGDSHIPYRGKGASRMACISLLMRRAVFERNGYFDAIRVGADTEYIERISVSFGEDGFNFVDIPTMLMTQHDTSLTGGGRFHISWRSITGYRLEHHSSFRAWHKKIAHGEAIPYLPNPLRVRPFKVPEEMLAGPHQWNIKIPYFSERIAQRHKRWWVDKQQPWQSPFSEKIQGRRFAEVAGIIVPDMYWNGAEMTEIPPFEELPSKVVIKPSSGWGANNVFCLIDGINILDGETYNRDKVLKTLEGDDFLKTITPTYMCEEFLIPEVGRDSDIIPRDYKFYCFGEQIALVHVVLRRSVKDKYANVHHYLDCDFREIPRKVMSNRNVPKEDFPMPDCWDSMVEDVRLLGRAMGSFMRIDMYATHKGAVFGEFTPTPEGGKGFTEWADKYLGTFWKGVEGADEGSITEPPEWAITGGLL